MHYQSKLTSLPLASRPPYLRPYHIHTYTHRASYGTIEPDAAASLSAMCNGPLDLSIEKTGQAYVLIGAGSAMGPLTKLLKVSIHKDVYMCLSVYLSV